MSYFRPVVTLAFIGYGNVAKEFVRLLHEKADSLPFSPAISGIMTRTLGCRWVPGAAFLPDEILDTLPPARRISGGVQSFIKRVDADVIVELTTLNIQNGEPAISHVQHALEAGKHVITANKGPIAFGYHKLQSTAKAHKVLLRFESAVCDGLPVFNLFRNNLPVLELRGIRGILNSTTNYVMEKMLAGMPQMNAVAEAQAAGIAEANAQHDLDGWDSAVKAAVLANVLIGPLSMQAIVRDSFRQRAPEIIARAARSGGKPQQVVRIVRDAVGIHGSVRLQVTLPDDPFFALGGFDNGLILETDQMGDIILVEKSPGLRQTAYGVLADLFNVYFQGIAPHRPPSLFDVEQEHFSADDNITDR